MTHSKRTAVAEDEALARARSGKRGGDSGPSRGEGGSGDGSQRRGDGSPGGGAPRRSPRGGAGGHGFFAQYKPDQGVWTRRGTFVGAGLLVVWGAMFLKGQLAAYEEGSQWWNLLITPGVPILLAVALGAVAWRITFVNRKSSDFMIATEGEMKKVSWSNKREVLGSTKVVITFTVLLAVLLFGVDVVFQFIFHSVGVLR